MARHVPNAAYERRFDLFGAAPNQYRFGPSVGNTKNPPYWGPSLVHDSAYPYYADQYARDVREWVACIEVDEKRQGQLLIFAFGGAATRLFDDLDAGERQNGVDLPDGRGGYYHIAGVEFIFRILQHKLPVHAEATVNLLLQYLNPQWPPKAPRVRRYVLNILLLLYKTTIGG